MDRPLLLVFFDIVFRKVIAGRIAAGQPLDDLVALWNRTAERINQTEPRTVTIHDVPTATAEELRAWYELTKR
jgi:hypothetical protein